MSETVGLCNQKGGVGKTTTAINLSASLAIAEKKALLIDFDPQSNASSGLGVQKNSIKTNSYELLLGQSSIEPTKTELPFLDLVPSTSDLVGAEVELVEFQEREFFLKKALEQFRGRYNYIFIDAPPSLGLLTVNVLVAADSVLIPVQAEYYGLEGLTDLLRTIDLVKGSLNPQLAIRGILLTMFDSRNNLAHEIDGEIRRHFKQRVFDTVIPRNVRLSESPSHGRPVILYDVRSRGAESYLELAKEFLKGRGYGEEGIGAGDRLAGAVETRRASGE